MLISFLLLPLLTAMVLLFIKKDTIATTTASVSSLITLFLAIYTAINKVDAVDLSWLPNLHSRFTLVADGLAKILILLTAIYVLLSLLGILISQSPVKQPPD